MRSRHVCTLLVALLMLAIGCVPVTQVSTSPITRSTDPVTGATIHRQSAVSSVLYGDRVTLTTTFHEGTGETCFRFTLEAPRWVYMEGFTLQMDDRRLTSDQEAVRLVTRGGRVEETVSACDITPELFAQFLGADQVLLVMRGQRRVTFELWRPFRHHFTAFYERFIAE